MDSSKHSTSRRIELLAARQLSDYDARDPGTAFAEELELTLDEAYAVQARVAALRLRRGEQIVGYKVGCTSPTIRRQLGIEHCVSGRLYDSEQHPTGCSLSRQMFSQLAIEGELALELACEPAEHHFSPGEIPGCVARVFPVIELHNHVTRGKRLTASELVANNAIHAGFVAGTSFVVGSGVCPNQGPNEPTLTISANGRVWDACHGQPLIQMLGSSLHWLWQVLCQRGEQLGAGQIILTGSIPGLWPVTEDCLIEVSSEPFGCVTVQFTD